ncbi:MAG: acyltransferase domain-containing protein, partial [Gammaproteobacteria bacterium]
FKADVTAGHSYGELVALCAAGFFDETALHQLSLLRGNLMATGEGDRGSMLAISATFEDVEKLIKDENLDLVIANHNAPKQIVLSGATDQIEKAVAVCTEQKLQATQLTVSAAFHSKFVADAEAPFADALSKIELHESTMTVLANTTADCYPASTDPSGHKEIKKLLAGQLANPVRFVAQIEKMVALGVRTFVEVGPGSRLSGLVRAILGSRQNDKEFQILTLDSSSGKRHGQYDLASLLANLAVLDKGINLSQWDANYLDSLDEISGKKPAMTISLSGANYVNPREKRPARPQQAKQVAQQQTQQQAELKNPVLNKPSLTGPSPDRQFTSTQQEQSALRATQESILALQKMQEQTAKLHQQYLQGQETAQQTISQLLLQQQALLGLEITTIPAPAPTVQAKNVAPVQIVPEAPVAIQQPIEQNKAAVEIVETVKAAHADEEVHSILLEVVAEKTGYPLDMLSLDMSLDTDLGIDSIKRVEILSALQERLPGAPTVNPEELGTFQLLENIVEFLVAAMPKMAETIPQTITPDTSSVSSDMLQNVLLDVVAEKTGYPLEMLSLDMNLDTDLGIDSIKRVEILSALQERMPEMPAVKPEDLGTLQTLQQIIEHMLASSPAAATPKPASPEAAVVDNTASIERQVLTAVPLMASQEKISLEKNATVWVTGEAPEFTQAICEALKQQDLKPEIVTLDALPDPDIAGLIILTPANPDQTFMKDSFMLVQRVSKPLRTTGKSNAAILACVTQMGGQFGLNGVSEACPVSGGIAGLIKTADKEWPEVSCKAIDVQYKDNVTELANNIVDECLTRDPLGGAFEVGITNEQRYTLELNTAAINGNKTSSTLNPNDVVVVTGGARGVTAEIAVALAETYQTNLLLLGRSEMPEPEETWLNGLTTEADIKKAVLEHNEKGLRLKLIKPKDIDNTCKKIIADREIRNNLQRIEATGVKVMYRAVDVRIKNKVMAAVDEARKSLGVISGFVHGAGVLADKL